MVIKVLLNYTHKPKHPLNQAKIISYIEEKAFNYHLSSQRIQVENTTLAKFKRFKVLSCRYRNHHKRLGLRLNLIAGIINRELGF